MIIKLIKFIIVGCINTDFDDFYVRSTYNDIVSEMNDIQMDMNDVH